jgi:AraC-like DNA-binding protein
MMFAIIGRMTTNIAAGPLAGPDVFSAIRYCDTDRHEMLPHSHDRGQFCCVVSGVMKQETAAGFWVVPRQRVIWIPPTVVHAARSKGPVEGWLVFAPAHYARQLPTRVCVLKASNLLLATLERLTHLADFSGAITTALSQVILFELDQAETEGLDIQLPRSQRLRAIAEQLLAEPSDGRELDTWARMAAQSRRSFTRHFEDETGLSFFEWRRRVIAQHAIDRLASGESVSSVALALGYQSVSAFIAMFKRLHGVSPAKFLAGRV